jgi:hypothetical protein
MIYQSWSGNTITPLNYSYGSNTVEVTWQQPPPDDDGGGALVGAKVPSPPLAPSTGAFADLQTLG